MIIRKLNPGEEIPPHLLLLADITPDLMDDYIRRGECFVAESHHQIIGVYMLLPTGAKTAEVVSVAILEYYRNEEIEKQLIMDAIQRVRLREYKTIEICIRKSNIDQLAFYQKCGFRITGIDKNFSPNTIQKKLQKMRYSVKIEYGYHKIYNVFP